MTTLANLKRAPADLEIDGQTIQIYPLRLGQIAELLGRHPRVAAAWQVQGADRGPAIVQALIEAGPTVINDVIDAGTRSEPGTAAAADLDPIDEAEILLAIFERTMPADEERAKNFMARLTELMKRVAGQDPKSSGQESYGPASSTS